MGAASSVWERLAADAERDAERGTDRAGWLTPVPCLERGVRGGPTLRWADAAVEVVLPSTGAHMVRVRGVSDSVGRGQCRLQVKRLP